MAGISKIKYEKGITRIYAKQGDTWTFQVTVKDKSTGNPIDLTGAVVAGQIRKTYSSTSKFDWICSVPQPTNGTIQISLPASVTATITCADSPEVPDSIYVTDIQITFSNGTVQTILEGYVHVSPEVTK